MQGQGAVGRPCSPHGWLSSSVWKRLGVEGKGKGRGPWLNGGMELECKTNV